MWKNLNEKGKGGSEGYLILKEVVTYYGRKAR